MVLAAGVGSRLRPLTELQPKALIKIGGVPMLERVIERLKRAGVDAIVINAHHLPDQIEAFLKSRSNFGIQVEISREPELLDTGGGLKKIASFFDDGRSFYLHNVDILTDLDLSRMYKTHNETKALATLAVRARDTSGRYLFFDPNGRLCGYEIGKRSIWAKDPAPKVERLAFDGVHVVSPEIFPKMTESGVFPILQAYLRLAGQEEKILAFRTDGSYWKDIGAKDKLASAEADAAAGRIPH